MTLDEIGLKHATDKSSSGHRYLGFYERLFPARTQWIQILEVGIQFGNSLRTLKEYFPNATIVGIDSVDNQVRIDGVILYFGDAYALDMVNRFKSNTFDIIIDDASHAPADQRWFIEHYSTLLDKDGLLIVEDVRSRLDVEFIRTALPQGFESVMVETIVTPSSDSRLFIAWRV